MHVEVSTDTSLSANYRRLCLSALNTPSTIPDDGLAAIKISVTWVRFYAVMAGSVQPSVNTAIVSSILLDYV